jgi:hypothetical protein
MAKIPWFSHFGHLATDITFINVVSSPIGIALRALAVSFATGVADPIGISAPVDSIVVVPILRPIDFARSVPLSCHIKTPMNQPPTLKRGGVLRFGVAGP